MEDCLTSKAGWPASLAPTAQLPVVTGSSSVTAPASATTPFRGRTSFRALPRPTSPVSSVAKCTRTSIREFVPSDCCPTRTGCACAPMPQMANPPIAGSDTAFRVALAGHSMTVTHTDGYPVQPTDVDALLMGMGERYDVIVTAGDGVFPLVAMAEGKNARARALLSTGAGTAPDQGFQPPELNKRVGTVDMLTATPAVDLGSSQPDVNLSAVLPGDMMHYNWTTT